jgi:hypothetical protein
MQGSPERHSPAAAASASKGSARTADACERRWVELAWLWLRWQPDSTLSAWFRVALARKLLIAL